MTEKTRNWNGRFKLDDDIRRAWNSMSNTDDLIEVLDLVGEHKTTVESAVEALDALEQSGMLTLAKSLNDTDTTYDFNDRPLLVQQLHGLIQGINDLDADTVNALLDQLPDGSTISPEELADPPRVGLFGALKQFRDPEVQRGIGKLFILLKALGSSPEDRTNT